MQTLPDIKHIIAIASGKGGVGKSTTAVNLALALSQENQAVGLLDADIYGPSQAIMLGVIEKPESHTDNTLQPIERYGLQTMSIAYLIDTNTPTIWRGPMATSALLQLFTHTQWKKLDYLVIDLPPGTGDIHLTLSQKIPLAGAVIVTTPQDVALIDAKKAIAMFEKVHVPIVGIIENMSTHICSKCGHEEAIFGEGGGLKIAEEMHTKLLGTLPLDINIRLQMDAGLPTVIAEPEGKTSQIYQEIAKKIIEKIDNQTRLKAKLPKIIIENR